MCTVFIHVHWPRITSGRPGSRVVVVWWSSGSPDHHKGNNNCIFFSQSACACSRADCLHMQSCGDTPRSDTMLDSDRTHARAFATFSAYFTCNPGHVYICICICVYVLSPPFSYIYICLCVRNPIRSHLQPLIAFFHVDHTPTMCPPSCQIAISQQTPSLRFVDCGIHDLQLLVFY